MRTGGIIEASRALALVRSHAASVGQVELPRFIGRSAAKADLTAQMTQAAADAERAATTLLGVEGFSPESVGAIRTAARILGHGPPDRVIAQRAADSLRRSADAAEASWASSIERDPNLAGAHLAQLMAEDADTLAAYDWPMLRRLLAATPEEVGRPRRIEGAPSFDEAVERHAAIPFVVPTDFLHIRRYFAAWRLGDDMPTPARSASANALLQRSPAELGTDDWRTVLALLDSDPYGQVLPRTRTLELLRPVRDVVERLAKQSSHGPTHDWLTPRDHAAIERYQAAWRLEGTTIEERSGLLRQLVTRDPAGLDRRDWATLHALIVDHTRAIHGPRELDGLVRFDEIAAGNVERPARADALANVGRYFDAWRLASAPAEERLATASALFRRDPSELSPADWGNLRTLLESDPEGVVLRGPRAIDGLQSFRAVVAENAAGSSSAPGLRYQVNRYLSAWRSLLDPAYPAKVAAALDEVARGRSSPDARRIVAAEGHRLAELVAGRAPDEQAAIASVMLEMPDITATRGVEGTLELLRGGLATSHADANVEGLRRQTLELVERNLSRLTGVTPDGAVRGWGNHPDYAEIGRIRENVTLLDHLARAERAAADAAASGAETLAW